MNLRPVRIVGVGLTSFDKHDDRSVESLAREAVIAAMRDGGLERTDIQAAYTAHLYQGEVFGQRVLRELAFPEIMVINVENACAGGSTAVRDAWLAIGTGQCDVALAIGAEKMGRGLISFVSADVELALGSTAPAQYALAGNRHMHEFGTSPEAFARIAVKSRAHAARNPNARFRDTVSLEEVMQSRPIAEPLTLLQCCRNGSGAAAVVLASDDWVRRRGAAGVRILSSGLASIMADKEPRDLTSFGATRAAARIAYDGAGLGPEDVDVIELHDAFTVGEFLHYEGLGLCAKGEATRLVMDEETTLGGRTPVNLSGGLLAKSHPLGATGVAQFVELTWQLRGAATGRQVEGARIALAHSQGGTGLEAGATCVTLLARD
ncbi:thiolase family protein [Vineibacter terrae]|uniref:Thiolase family protein n=1 Tax=Vineibacter terrae TaxID=2586908 RepID=A0A5C8P8I4_9HYPH|nr:thiolase family protein [Vineibacter terrae]TXL69862.1 thiolase family protein [Vineibacter terrae]